MKAGKAAVTTLAAPAASMADDGADRIDAVRRQIAEVQAEHDDACARRWQLQQEIGTLGERLADAESRMRTAKRMGHQPSPQDELEAKRLGEQIAAKTHDLNAAQRKTEEKNAELRELQTTGLQRAFSGGTIEAVLRAQRELQGAVDETAAIQAAIDEQRALLAEASSSGSVTAGAAGGESVSDLLAKAALGQIDSAELERKRREIAELQAAADKAGVEREARLSVIQATIQGLERALDEKKAAVAQARKRADHVFAQFVAAEQDALVARYGELARETADALRRMLALDLLGRPLGVPPLLNDNWSSSFSLPAMRREIESVQERPSMPGVLAAGSLLSEPKARAAAQTEERDRLRARGVTLV